MFSYCIKMKRETFAGDDWTKEYSLDTPLMKTLNTDRWYARYVYARGEVTPLDKKDYDAVLKRIRFTYPIEFRTIDPDRIDPFLELFIILENITNTIPYPPQLTLPSLEPIAPPLKLEQPLEQPLEQQAEREVKPQVKQEVESRVEPQVEPQLKREVKREVVVIDDPLEDAIAEFVAQIAERSPKRRRVVLNYKLKEEANVVTTPLQFVELFGLEENYHRAFE